MVKLKWIKKTLSMACMSIGLIACGSDCPPQKNRFHIYMVLAPINDDQRKLAEQFIVNAKENIQGATQIIIPNNFYTVVKLCQGDQPDFRNSRVLVKNSSHVDAVTENLEKFLSQKQECNVTAMSLVNLSRNLNEAAASKNPEKLIILVQTPWGRNEIDDQTLKKIKEGMEKLAQSDKIEKIILFGVNEAGADRLSKSFYSFNENGQQKFDSAIYVPNENSGGKSNDPNDPIKVKATINLMERIRQENLCPKKS